jgi:molecular chaperone GrpE
VTEHGGDHHWNEAKHDSPTAEEPRVVVRDRRKIDPETGQVRVPPEQPAEQPTGGMPGTQTEPATAEVVGAEQELKKQLDERTADLQRLQAEYANYRKRVERDRESIATAAKAALAADLLLVLDDVDRADAHGDLNGAFKAVADKLVTTLTKAGLEPFGYDGEPFDPSVHQAVQHTTSPDVDGPTVTAVLRRGYRFGEKVVRAALVAVTDYEAPAEAPAADAGTEPEAGEATE